MKNLLSRLWTETSGVLSFEWITLNSVVALGVVGGLSSVRDALNDEMADMTEAITSLDQSYTIQPPRCVAVGGRGNGSGQFQTAVQTGMGYSKSEWTALLKSHPELAGQQGLTRTSGGVGSRFIDKKPEVNPDDDPQPMPNPSKMIDDSLAPPANKQ